MQILYIIFLSVLARTSADVLQVKCGDEMCERPSNRAVTTLRYTPDKPYKLPINAVNSEVEIFGVTDDLFYIRHGKSYGFLPKAHLREKVRGNFPHSVEIDLGLLKINQEMRETNFLHNIVKSSHSISNQNINDNSNETKEDVKREDQTVKETVVKEEERASDYIPIGTEPLPKSAETEDADKKMNVTSEENNDSGVEDDEEDDDEGEDDEEGDDEEDDDDGNTLGEIFDALKKDDDDAQKQKEKKMQDEPEIPPKNDHLDEKSSDIINTPEEIKSDNATITEEMPKIEEKFENIVPLTSGNEINIEVSNDTNKVELDEKGNENLKEQIPESKNLDSDSIVVNNDTLHDEHKDLKDSVKPIENDEEKASNELPSTNIPQLSEEKIPKTTEETLPAPVTEEIIEEVYLPEITTENSLFVEISKPDINLVEATTESLVDISNKEIDEKKIEEVVEVKTETNIVEEEKEIKTPDEKIVKETIQKEKPPSMFEQDMLLKRFDEKLGHKNVDGVGSIEQINKGHDHQHHNHDHHHHNHQHHNHDHKHHNHDQQQPHTHDHQQKDIHVEDNNKESNILNNEDDLKPGFFAGLFKKIFGDENEKEEEQQHIHHEKESAGLLKTSDNANEGFCEKIDSENCPQSLKKVKQEVNIERVSVEWKSVNEYLTLILHEAVDMMDLIISMGLTSITILIFIFGYYCINKTNKEAPLIAKMNELERHLMASVKENEVLKGEVIVTKQKLLSIEDNSFGSNDMVIALKNDLEVGEKVKEELLEKISSLEKELEAAAEDGLELNKMVSELLSSQTGSDSIISSVEDLQRQLNEQQETIITMNETLATKSRENTELQIQLSEMSGQSLEEMEKFKQQFDAIVLERSNLQIELENLKRESDLQVNQIIEERNGEVTRLNKELTSYASKYEESKKLLNSAESRVQALEECIDTIKKNKGGDFKKLLDVADLKADLLAVSKEKSTMQEQLQNERDSRKLLEDRGKSISEEMSNLKKEFSLAEKEKLEAQTRLEVLSTYFKEKEMQLQQELSVKEARWMKQQGETTTTVEKVQALNEEIQNLKSRNDSLRAEIDAQDAAHKLNLTTIEAQAHSAWLNARQAERKLEESRMEAAALRRRLTSIAENPSGASDLLNGLPGMTNDSMNSIPSPLRVESPNNINAGLPPGPPMMMPPPFLPGAPPFLPPFLPPPGGEMPPMGLPPLGRLMSPPPKRFTPTMRDDRDRYSPRGRGRFSPDSRYDDYTAFETETDYSPPPSPSPPRRGYNSPSDRSKKSKGGHSSADSNQPSRRK